MEIEERKEIIMDLLERAIRKYRELKNRDFWKKELLDAPPILWFGNIDSKKKKIVTIAANPSSHEFDDGEVRFEIDENWESFPDIEDEKKREIIYESFVYSYNKYFTTNPYKGWFGETGRLEAFLNGLDTTFYEEKKKEEKKKKYTYQAVHIDLFPFATKHSFRYLKENHENVIIESLFNEKDCWGQRFLVDLLKLIKPEFAILFAKTNMEFFEKIYKKCVMLSFKKIKGKKIPDLGECKKYNLMGYEIYAMSSLYPPFAYMKADKLRELGRRFREEFIENKNEKPQTSTVNAGIIG